VNTLIMGIISLALVAVAMADQPHPARIGSKIFTEGYILSEILAVQLESHHFPVERMMGLGATGITEEAMKNKKIDLIVDYTGSITQAFFKSKEKISTQEIRDRLKPLGFTISEPLGFNNTYALAVRAAWSEKNKIKTFSQLATLPVVRAAFTSEFTSRPENWPGLKAQYNFKNFDVHEMDHQLAYESVRSDKADVVEAYSTDAKLKEFGLISLEDDQHFFPNYDAVIMTHLDWVEANPEAWKTLQELVGKIPASTMIELNSQVDLEKKSFYDVASGFLGVTSTTSKNWPWLRELKDSTLEHLTLVLVPVFFALLIGVPLSFFAYKFPRSHSAIGALASIFQTIPALAFLTLLVPLVGIGTVPALTVLFLYAILPIFLSGYQGFASIPEITHLSCQTLGLHGFFKLRKIEFPMAQPAIWAGLQTSLITTVASATLAALIGAGGYGKKIIAGLAVNDMRIVLMGAIPSAVMALIFQFICHRLSQKTLRLTRRRL
jgi:osmoprotectant transport system permease protein